MAMKHSWQQPHRHHDNPAVPEGDGGEYGTGKVLYLLFATRHAQYLLLLLPLAEAQLFQGELSTAGLFLFLQLAAATRDGPRQRPLTVRVLQEEPPSTQADSHLRCHHHMTGSFRFF